MWNCDETGRHCIGYFDVVAYRKWFKLQMKCVPFLYAVKNPFLQKSMRERKRKLTAKGTINGMKSASIHVDKISNNHNWKRFCSTFDVSSNFSISLPPFYPLLPLFIYHSLVLLLCVCVYAIRSSQWLHRLCVFVLFLSLLFHTLPFKSQKIRKIHHFIFLWRRFFLLCTHSLCRIRWNLS